MKSLNHANHGSRQAALVAVTLAFLAPAYAFADAPATASRSLTLADAIAIGERENPRVMGANADASLASAQASGAAATEKPTLSTTTYTATGSAADIYTSSPGVLPGNIMALPSQSVADQNVTLMIPLYTGGRLHDQTLSARNLANAGARTADATRAEVARDVALAYDQALLTASLVDVAKSRADAEDEQVRVTSLRVNTGAAAPVDLAREQAEQADAESALASATSDAALAVVDLDIAMGEPATEPLALADTLDGLYSATPPQSPDPERSGYSDKTPAGAQNSGTYPDVSIQSISSIQSTKDTIVRPGPESLADAIGEALRNRPEALAAAANVAAVQKAVDAVDGEYGPQVYGVAMADASAASSTHMGMNGGSTNAGYSIGITVSLPLIDGVQRRADRDAAAARLARAQANQQIVNQSIDRDVASAWLALQASNEQHAAAVDGVTAANQAYSLADLRYNAGKSTTAERLDALAAATRARGALATATAAVLDAGVRLRWAVGEGCSEFMDLLKPQ